jgi:hypothetical protein
MWFLIALVVGIGITALGFWLSGKGMKFTWYEWLIAIVGVMLLMFAIQNYLGSMAENESTAATKHLLYEGIPAIVLMGITYGLIVWRKGRTAS